ncbi:MAG: DMT family transporter [Gammaproteobacteria bacterium]|nr:DMT family transporter [Pseudomonadales bacterium]MCP5348125.1 DMT family transporter [Pseudomonadales bacterium]
MTCLWFVTALWAFSFSLIGEYLSGQVDNYFAVMSRVVLALLVFLPFLLRYPVRPRFALQLMGIGALQLGLMYLFYYQSFVLLSVPEVLIFTIFTPVYVTLIYDLLTRRFHPRYALTALLAVAGAAIIRYTRPGSEFWLGFLLVQASNLCFAAGQVLYKRLLEQQEQTRQHRHFGWFYVGATLVTVPAWLLLGGTAYPGQLHQWLIILWLGLVASGAGYFLWNLGASRVNSGNLAIMNNALIPAGLVVNLLLWNQDAGLLRLILGSSALMLALWINHRWRPFPGKATVPE